MTLLAVRSPTPHNGFSREVLARYEDEVERLFGKREEPMDVLPRALTLMAAHYLMKTQWFTRQFMLDRWFLHR